jgi:hypothetical protein
VPNAAWHWGSDSSVFNDPLGEQGRTPLYVGLLSAWGSLDGDRMFSPFCRRAPFSGTPVDINEQSDHWLKRRIISLHRGPLGNMEGVSLPGL